MEKPFQHIWGKAVAWWPDEWPNQRGTLEAISAHLEQGSCFVAIKETNMEAMPTLVQPRAVEAT